MKDEESRAYRRDYIGDLPEALKEELRRHPKGTREWFDVQEVIAAYRAGKLPRGHVTFHSPGERWWPVPTTREGWQFANAVRRVKGCSVPPLCCDLHQVPVRLTAEQLAEYAIEPTPEQMDRARQFVSAHSIESRS